MSSHDRVHDDADLMNATFTATSSAVYANGDIDEPEGITLPLRTSTYREDAHLAIRDAEGSHVDYLTMGGPNDVLLDMALPGWAMRSGWSPINPQVGVIAIFAGAQSINRTSP
jgi:hypothetical protein